MTMNRAGEKWGGRDVENVTVMESQISFSEI